MARGDYTRSALAQKATELEEHWVMVRLARELRPRPQQGAADGALLALEGPEAE